MCPTPSAIYYIPERESLSYIFPPAEKSIETNQMSNHYIFEKFIDCSIDVKGEFVILLLPGAAGAGMRLGGMRRNFTNGWQRREGGRKSMREKESAGVCSSSSSSSGFRCRETSGRGRGEKDARGF